MVEKNDDIASPQGEKPGEENTPVADPKINKQEEKIESQSELSEKSDSQPTVPYGKFKSERERRKAAEESYQELIKTVEQAEVASSAKSEEVNTDDEDERALKIVDQRAAKIVNEKTSKLERELQVLKLKSELELTRNKHEDFDDFAESIAAKKKAIPGISFEDAYIISKFEAGKGISLTELNKEEVRKAKAQASVESSSKNNSPANTVKVEDIDPMAKGSDGKFLYSLSELESILPKSSKE